MLQMSKKKLFMLSVFLLSLFSIGCVSGQEFRHIEEFVNRKHQIPFVLLFPSDLKMDSDLIEEIHKKKNKTIWDMWTLARFYHIVARQKSDESQLKEIYQGIIQIEPRYRFMALTNLACLLSDYHKYKESEKLFHQLLTHNSPNIMTYYNLYLLYKYSGRLEDSIKVLVMMTKQFPKDITAFVELGNLFMDREKYSQAEKYYQQAMKINPDSHTPIYRMAKLREAQKQYKNADILFQRCIKRFPDFRNAYLDYSKMLLARQKGEKAKIILKKALKRFGNKKIKNTIR